MNKADGVSLTSMEHPPGFFDPGGPAELIAQMSTIPEYDIIQFILDEVRRQRKSFKKISIIVSGDHSLLYRWQSGQTKTKDIRLVQRVLAILGYDLVPLPKGRVE